MRALTQLRDSSGENCVRMTDASTAFGLHFTPAELAAKWNFHETTIRRMFQEEPGVLKIGKSRRRDGKRNYLTLRIPAAVALRVYEKRTR